MFTQFYELGDNSYVLIDDEIRIISGIKRNIKSGILIIYSDNCPACLELSKKYYKNKLDPNKCYFKINADNKNARNLIKLLNISMTPVVVDIIISENNYYPYIKLKNHK